MNRIVSRLPLFLSLLVVCSVAALSAGCGAPTMESQISRYKAISDRLDLLATKQPQFKVDIEKKKLEFAAELELAKSKPGEEGARAVADLCYRMDKFEAGLNPQPAAATKPAGSKLGPPQAGQPVQPGQPGQPAQPVQPGKLGGAGAPTAPQPAGNTGGSGFGTPTPAPAPNPGDSGFGTPTPAPAPAPTAPAPAPAPEGGSGFGGK